MTEPRTVPRTEYERWAQLVDRQADDQVLTDEELSFCQSFEQSNPLCALERAAYAQLSALDSAPTDASRALVDRALQKLEADEAEQAVDAARLLRGPRLPHWLALSAAVATLLAVVYTVRLHHSDDNVHALAAASGEATARPALPLARTELVYTAGSVTLTGANSGAGRTLLPEGSAIETGAGGACVLIDSDINVCLAEHSRMRLTAIATAARRIELEAGKLATRLSTQPEGMSLSITVDGVASTAVGTAFSVERKADAVITTVLNGKVRVGRADDTVIVNAHERADRRAEHAAVTSVSRAEESPAWALLGPTVLWHDPVTASLEVRGTPAGAEAWLDEQLIGTTPLYTLLPVGQHRVVVRKGSQELAVRELHADAGSSQEVEYHALQANHDTDHDSNKPAPTVESKDNKARSSAATSHNTRITQSVTEHPEHPERSNSQDAAVDAANLLRLARQAVRAERFDDAAQTYETLIKKYGGSDESQTALVLLGQLRLTRMQDARGALRALDGYLKLGGSLELEASAARIEALHQLKRTAEETAAIDEFLRRHPRSFEAKALRARSGLSEHTP